MASPLRETQGETSSETDLLDLSDDCLETEVDELSVGIAGSVELIPKKNTKSPVWNYFGFTPGDEGRPTNYCFPKCKLCFKDVSAKFGNTSNLMKHLRLHHHHEFSEVSRARASSSSTMDSSRKSKGIDDKQPTLQHCFEQRKMYSTSSKEHKKLSMAVTNFIVRDVMPLYIVEKGGFRAMVEILNPRYTVGVKTTLT